MAEVARLAVAPVKSLGLLHPEEIALEPFGVLENRRFHLIDDAGRLVNGKLAGGLVQVEPAYWPDREYLTMKFPDGTVAEGWLALGDEVTTDFYGRPVAGHVVEGPWAEPLSELAGMRLRLVQPDEPGAGLDRGRGHVSLVSDASLAALAQAAGQREVDGRRFRMLVYLTGCGPHEEDEWLGRNVQLGGAVVRLREQVARCAVTIQNPDTGEPDLDTLRMIKDYRGFRDGRLLDFGVWGEVVEPGPVRVGDPVEPLPS